MNNAFRAFSLVFAAGCAGGLANSLMVWLFGDLGISAHLGVRIAPLLTPAWLYPRLVWGGLWGCLFLLPFWRRSWLGRGLVYSLGPTIVQLCVVFPLKAKKGFFGLALGNMTPLLVFFFNAIWGMTASLWLRLSK